MTTVCSAPGCGKVVPQRSGKRARLYCDSLCRNRASRARRANPDAVVALPAAPPPPPDTSLADVVRRDLEAAERLETLPGQIALALALRMTAAGTTASSVASLSKELRALMAEALAGTVVRRRDLIDEIGARREQKAAGA
jgi:hypothetical protein